MSITISIQKFLNVKFHEHKILRKDFINASGIKRSSISELLNGIPVNPSLVTILKIANYFNCSIDEILGRVDYIEDDSTKYIKINPIQMSNNTKDFIVSMLKENNISSHQLAASCNIGTDTVNYFIKKHDSKKNLSTRTIYAVANFFNISIDKIVGRV